MEIKLKLQKVVKKNIALEFGEDNHIVDNFKNHYTAYYADCDMIINFKIDLIVDKKEDIPKAILLPQVKRI